MGAKNSKPVADMEMAQMAGKERGASPADDGGGCGGHETEFQPINWKRVFFSWKYLRTLRTRGGVDVTTPRLRDRWLTWAE